MMECFYLVSARFDRAEKAAPQAFLALPQPAAEATHAEQLRHLAEWTRQSILEAMERGAVFMTAFLNLQGEWFVGPEVHAVRIEERTFLKTVEDEKASDNFQSIAPFPSYQPFPEMPRMLHMPICLRL